MITYEILVSSLSVLVTALIGWNVIQFLIAEKKVKEIVEASVSEISEDAFLMLRTKNLRTSAFLCIMHGKFMKAIDIIVQVVEGCYRCRVDAVRDLAVSESLTLLESYIEYAQSRKMLYILDSSLSHYEAVLGNVQGKSRVLSISILSVLRNTPIQTEEEEALRWSPKDTLRIVFPEAPERFL